MRHLLGLVSLGIILAGAVGCARLIDILVEEKGYDPGHSLGVAPMLSAPVSAAPLYRASSESLIVADALTTPVPPSVAAPADGQTVTDAALQDVYFDYDSWRLTEESMQRLLHDAEWLRQHPSHSLLIEGHCDERGTLGYNLVLGERRARAVRNYLLNLDIPANRLTAVSYGKERPFCSRADEGCYRENRRGHLVGKTMMSQVP